MERYKSLLLIMVIFLSLTKVNAAACDNNEKVNYQEKAKNISYSYKYVDNDTFNITFTNIDSSFYLVNMENMQEYDYANGEMTINNITPGKSYRFNVFTKDDNPCSSSSIYSIYITLPYYNPYYTDSLCEGIKNYKYCKKFINKMISSEEFEKSVTKYRKSLEREKEKTNKKTNLPSMFSYAIDFYLDYYFIILPVIIIASITVIIKHNKKEELF